MWFPRISLIFLSAFVCCTHCLNYGDLEDTGKSCPRRDKCDGYRKKLTYIDRNCECDPDCVSYNDCCIDFSISSRRRPSGRKPTLKNVKCLPYGHKPHTGVYAISDCSKNWNGPREVREKCVGPPDWTDPYTATPVVDRKNTYRNLFCAECNYADRDSFRFLQLEMECENLSGLSDEQILGDLTYHNNTWGIYRYNENGAGADFIKCNILFDVPGYLNNSVRFCRSNIVSKCAPGWPSPRYRRTCEEYMAVVYDKQNVAYRNPHCAICNNINVENLACTSSDLGRTRPFSFALLLDINPNGGGEVGKKPIATPQCPYNEKYDPFFKKCRPLVCALPGYKVVDGVCVQG